MSYRYADSLFDSESEARNFAIAQFCDPHGTGGEDFDVEEAAQEMVDVGWDVPGVDDLDVETAEELIQDWKDEQ